jgi:hypothetical protein
MQAAASVPEVLYPGAVVSGHGVGFELPTAHVQLHQSHGGGGGTNFEGCYFEDCIFLFRVLTQHTKRFGSFCYKVAWQ